MIVYVFKRITFRKVTSLHAAKKEPLRSGCYSYFRFWGIPKDVKENISRINSPKAIKEMDSNRATNGKRCLRESGMLSVPLGTLGIVV